MTMRMISIKAMEQADDTYDESQKEIFYKSVMAVNNVMENIVRMEKI